MFYRRPITKRIFAACGVAIALVGSLQHSHALCRFSGCSQSAADHEYYASNCCQSGECRQPETAATAASICVANPHELPGPCPKGCWCCQDTSPLQPTSSVNGDSLEKSLATCSFVGSAVVEASGDPSAAISTAIEVSPRFALEVCARLCRFLI